MIEHIGDLLSVTSGIIVHGCNAQGVMGSGVAAAIAAKWPGCYKIYNRSKLRLGSIIWYKVHDEQLYIANAITQEHYGNDKVHLDYHALYDCMIVIASQRLPIHMPLIGCGLAGGRWEIAKPIIEAALGNTETHLWRLK